MFKANTLATEETRLELATEKNASGHFEPPLYSPSQALLEDEETTNFQQHAISTHSPLFCSRRAWKLSCGVNIVLFLAVVFLGMQNYMYPNPTLQNISQVSIPSSSGIKFDKLSTYQHHSAYWSSDDTTADELWDQLSTDPLVVAIPNDTAEQQGLPKSAPWPWDATRGRYFIRAFHELHCLKYIRRYVTDVQRNNGTSDLIDIHVLHCIDSLRQGIMCRADDTLMPTSDETSFAIGDHETLKCRDWDKLSAWALSSERNACHRSLSDYKAIHHPIERYAFCPDDSPHKVVADRYFALHGHHDPWKE